MTADAVDDVPQDPTAGGPEPDPLTPVGRPLIIAGDLTALEPGRLAAAGAWPVLAALALHGESSRRSEALRQLAVHAHDPAAFTWLWAVVTAQPGTTAWQALLELPNQLVLPEALTESVAVEVSGPPSDNRQRDRARVAVLMSLDPAGPGAAAVARAVLAAKHGVMPEVREEAARVLGATRDRHARTLLLIATTDEPWPQRGQLLSALQAPLEDEEVEPVLAAIEDGHHHLSTHAGATDVHWVSVRRLVAALPAPAQLALLTQGWVSEPGYAAVLLPGPVIQALGAEEGAVIRQLLDRAAAGQLPDPVLDAVLAELHTLPELLAVDLAERAHKLLPPERTTPARRHYLDRARMYREEPTGRNRDRVREPALAALARMALAEPPALAEPAEAGALGQDAALREYAGALTSGEVSHLGVSSMAGGQRRRLGTVLGLRLTDGLFDTRANADQQRAAAEAVTADTIAVLGALDDQGAAEVLTGLVSVASGLVSDRLVLAALDAGPVSTAVIAQATPAATAATLRGGGTRWPPSRALDVLEATAPDTTIRMVEDLAGALDWAVLESSGSLPRAAAALARHPRLLRAAVRTAVRSQDGPETQAASPARVRALVDALVADEGGAHAELAGQAGREQPEEVAPLITVLVEAPQGELHEVAGHWLACAAPTPPLVDLVIRAHEDFTGDPNPYSPALTGMAAQLCADAQDSAQEPGTRIEALQGAQRLDPGRARATALDLIEKVAVPLRRAAAGVIATTSPSTDEGDRLSALATAQRDRGTRELLELARRRLTSGSVGEALENAVELVGAEDSLAGLDPAICLPDPRAHGTFRACVDQARTSAIESPTSRLNAMNNLAELLGEQAVASYWQRAGTAKEKERAEKLLARAADMDDIGSLAIQQQPVQRLGWLPNLAALRQSRTAHPAPLGSTTPLELTEADAVSAVPLLRRVLEGWVQEMYTAAGQPLPPVTR